MALTSAQKNTVTARLHAMLPDIPHGSEMLVSQLIDDAAEWAEAYTQRSSVLDGMLIAIGDLAIVEYNRMGTEGESGRSEGGESYSFETAPQRIYDVLNRYRLARVGGSVYEAAKAE